MQACRPRTRASWHLLRKEWPSTVRIGLRCGHWCLHGASALTRRMSVCCLSSGQGQWLAGTHQHGAGSQQPRLSCCAESAACMMPLLSHSACVCCLPAGQGQWQADTHQERAGPQQHGAHDASALPLLMSCAVDLQAKDSGKPAPTKTGVALTGVERMLPLLLQPACVYFVCRLRTVASWHLPRKEWR